MNWTSSTGIALLAAIVGAASALLSALITNCFNLFIQWRQRQHDAGQKGLDRLSMLRREVYLEAVQLCTAAVTELSQLVHEGDEAERQRKLNGVAISVGKVQLVCTPMTALRAQTLGTTFAMALQGLTVEASKARKLEAKARTHTGLISDVQLEQKNIVELMRQYNLSGRDDPKYWGMLSMMNKGALERHTALVDARSAMHNEHAVEVGKFQILLMTVLSPLNDQMRGTLDCLRSELGLAAPTQAQVDERKKLETMMKASFGQLSEALASHGTGALDVMYAAEKHDIQAPTATFENPRTNWSFAIIPAYLRKLTRKH
ncbi:hypothetical protein [Dyella terrae]|uniref:hypothetical protein n=1 Tax=Dyella terrae TaxID=522259 RepID=UPI001EFCB25C|nr:hypothetical protein [Dyella terrae]ULU25277.1 hypothetical protein DYST_02202 [Dyella terrae]